MISIFCDTGEIISFPTDSFVGWNFSDTDLHRADLDGMNLNQAIFKAGHLRNVNIENATAIEADFSFAALMCAYLRGTDFSHSNFYKSRPIAANFTGSILINTDFSSSDVRGADFTDTNLCGAKCKFSTYEEAIFKGALFDKYTQWPDGFDPIEHGAVLIK